MFSKILSKTILLSLFFPLLVAFYHPGQRCAIVQQLGTGGGGVEELNFPEPPPEEEKVK